MAPEDLRDEIKSLDSTLSTIESVIDVSALRKELDKLNVQATAPDLWDDQENAQKVTTRLAFVKDEIDGSEELRRRLDDARVLLELAIDEHDEAASREVETEISRLRKDIDDREIRTLLNGEYDSRGALLTIRAEAGGADATAFAEELMRMYLRWAERHHYPTEVYDVSPSEEAGIKSATFAVKAPYMYGTLSVEQGTHRMVRISAYDNQGRRQTCFAGVEVLPLVEQDDHVDIPEGDIRVDVFRSSGPGGQSVNTTDSAVRLTHLPTGIVVSCQNEKSQLQNRAAAMRVLEARLLERQRQEQKAEMDALKGDSAGSWGTQMRSYVLHPYQMVKDLRTGWETNNPDPIFAGEIDELLAAGIRWRKQQEIQEGYAESDVR